MNIRPATDADFEAIWSIFREVVASEDTYPFAANTSRATAFAYWCGPGVASYVAEDEGRIVGMYKIVQNQPDLGSHVANASYMVARAHSRKGIGREMGEHSLREARRRGFLAMQFNFVVSTNVAAVTLWRNLGFAIIGTLPKVFRHRDLGYVDAHVMYRSLESIE